MIVGCGSGGHRSTTAKSPIQVANPVAARVSAWSSAATSYNATLQGCRQPDPTHGYVAACTREWRLNYTRATARLLMALSNDPSSGGCRHPLAKARSLAIETATALQHEFKAYGAWLDNRPYHGSAISSSTVDLLLRRATSTTKRDTTQAESLSADIRRGCGS